MKCLLSRVKARFHRTQDVTVSKNTIKFVGFYLNNGEYLIFILKNAMLNFLKTNIINLPFYKHLYRLRLKSKLTAIAFHRVINQNDTLLKEANPLWTVTQEQFYYLIEILHQNFNIINPVDIGNFFSGKYEGENPMIITFDDGWRDNYLYAYPILKEFNIKALFFIATKTIGSDKYFWEESVYAKLCCEKNNEAVISQLCKKINLDPSTETNFSTSVNRIIEKLHNMDVETRNVILHEFNFHPVKSESRMYLNIEEIQDMYENGMVMGSHGNTHDPCNAESVHKEIFDSREKLKKILGIYPAYLSWPHGIFENSFLGICKNYGLQYIFTSKSGLNTVRDSQFEIKRFFIPNWRMNTGHDFLFDKKMLNLLVFKDIK